MEAQPSMFDQNLNERKFRHELLAELWNFGREIGLLLSLQGKNDGIVPHYLDLDYPVVVQDFLHLAERLPVPRGAISEDVLHGKISQALASCQTVHLRELPPQTLANILHRAAVAYLNVP